MSNQEILDLIKKSFELKSQGFYKPAIEMLYKAINIAPDNLEILYQLAHLYKLLKELDRAVYYIEKVLDIDSNHFDALILMQEIHVEKNELGQAVALSEKICDLKPDNANFKGRIKILRKLNDIEKIKEFEQKLENPDDSVLYEIASAYFDYSDISKAKSLLEKAHEINSKNHNISELLGKIYFIENNLTRAKEFFEALSKNGENAEVFSYLGQISFNENDNEKAIAYFSKAHKLNEQNAQYLYNLASSYFVIGWLDDAALFFRKAICLEPMNTEYHYSLAYLYFQQGNYTAALGEVGAVMDIDSEHQMAKILHPMILAKQGDLLVAKQMLDKIIENHSSDDFAFYALYVINNELIDKDSAKKALLKAIEIKPSSLTYLSDYLEFEMAEKNHEEVKKIAFKIIEINDKFLQAHVALAQIYMEEKDFDKMHEEAQEIIELDCNCPNGYYYNAIALFYKGDKDFAIESLKKAISLDLNNAMLYLKMSEFYQDLNDLEAAYNWAQEAAEIDERNYNYRWLCAKIARALNRNEDALRNYSHCYRFASNDKELCEDYAEYLLSVGRDEQAKRILAKK